MFRTLAFLAAILASIPALAGERTHAVRLVDIDDLKAVFAKVESVDVAQARARIPGTITELSIDEGDKVEAGQAIAVVSDSKLPIRLRALDASLRALEAQLEQATRGKERALQLREKGTVPQMRLDDAITALDVIRGQLDAARAERAAAAQQVAEGNVLAPRSGRVTSVSAVVGAVVMPGEVIATIAADDFVLRIALPERHAASLAIGSSVLVGGEDDASGDQRRLGHVRQIYPAMENGQVIADVTLDDIGDFFVGQRARIWISVGHRQALLIPSAFLTTRFGLDYVSLRAADGSFRDTVVQVGQHLPFPDGTEGTEILSGLVSGDIIGEKSP